MMWPRSESCCSVAAGTRDSMETSQPSAFALREAGRFHCFLQIHPVVDEVRYKLRVRQRLHRASHDPESDMLVAFFHKGRNDGVERPFAARQNIGMMRLQRESASAIL